MIAAQTDSIFKVLADCNRRKMVKLLGQKEMTVGELVNALKLSQSATSQHLKLLKGAGLVIQRKHGNFRLYALKTTALRQAMSFFDKLWDQRLQQLKQNLENNE